MPPESAAARRDGEAALKPEALDDAVKEAEAREAKMKAKHSASVKALSAEYEALVLELTEAAEVGSADGEATVKLTQRR